MLSYAWSDSTRGGRLRVPSPSTQPKRVKAKIYPDQPMDNPSEIIVYLALLKRNCLK